MERNYLGVVDVHGKIKVVKSQDLRIVKAEIDRVLERPRKDYPHFKFQPEIYIVEPV